MSVATTQSGRRKACHHCRTLHLKCDQNKPSCGQCTKLGYHCVRGYKIQFRHNDNPSINGSRPHRSGLEFMRSQPWIRTPGSLKFHDETEFTSNLYHHHSRDGFELGAGPPLSSEEYVTSPQEIYTEHVGQSIDNRSLTPESHLLLDFSTKLLHPRTHTWQTPPSHLGWITPDAENTIPSFDNDRNATPTHDYTVDRSDHRAFNTDSPTFAEPPSLPQLYLENPVWPLANKTEALLFRYYCEHLARNFDLLDPQRHFRTVVPERSATCPILLNAIFALSARHLSRIGEYDPLASNKYHQVCLERLIPLLDESVSTAVLDENLLASTVVLRHLEEIELPLSNNSPSDQPSHLLGSHVFITAQERAEVSGGLREAAFWVALRQEIYVAFVHQRPIQRSMIPTLGEWTNQINEAKAPNYIWSRRIIVLCAEIIQYCFEADSIGPQRTYEKLAQSTTRWLECKSESFTPIYNKDAGDAGDESIFPQSWFWSDEVVVGWQHYHLAKILLSAYRPGMLRLGPCGVAEAKAVDAEIMNQVRSLCGICLSNPTTAPNYVYASMAISMVGDKFKDRREQEALLDILNVCDKQHGWPTAQARETLKDLWEWTYHGLDENA